MNHLTLHRLFRVVTPALPLGLLYCALFSSACARPTLLAQAAETEALRGKGAGGDKAADEFRPEFAAPFLEAELAASRGDTERALARLMPLAERPDAPVEVFSNIAEMHLAANAPDKALGVLQAGLKRFPESTGLYILQARALRGQGKYKEAIEALETGLKYQPTRQEALELLSDVHLQQLRQVTDEAALDKEMQALIKIYERMLAGRQGSDRMPPLLILSSLQLRRNAPLAALPYAREATELDSREPRAWLALGSVQEAQKQTTEALKTFTQALLLQPGDNEIRERIDTLLGTADLEARIKFYDGLAREYPAIKEIQDADVRLLLENNRWAAAEERLIHITTSWPDDSKSRLALVRAWLAQGKLEEGVKAAAAMAERKDEFAPLVTLSLAEALAQKGDITRALKLVNDLYAQNKNDEMLAIGAATLLGEAEKKDQAIELLKEFRGRHPASFKAASLQASLLGEGQKFDEAYQLIDGLDPQLRKGNEDALSEIRAQLLQNQKKWNESLEVINGLLQKHPENAGYQTSAGYALQMLGRMAEAEAHYREALKLSPDDPETLNTLGYFLAETRQKLDESLALILKAHQLEPTAGHIVDSLGWVYFQKGDYGQAVERLKQAIALIRPSAEAAEIYEHLGDAYEKLGDMEKARDAWRKALELDKDLATVRDKLLKK